MVIKYLIFHDTLPSGRQERYTRLLIQQAKRFNKRSDSIIQHHIMNYVNKISIKAWAEADRPREKLLLKGKQSLSDAELIAILMGSGSRQLSAVGLAQLILQSNNHNLNELGKNTVLDLREFKGIGEAKAITIIAALELGRRRQLSDLREKPQIRSSQDAYREMAPMIQDLTHEEFWVLLLNRANRILGRAKISSGGVSGTMVDAKLIFNKALEKRASSVMLFHNHPSGGLTPSQADISLTKKLREAGKFLDTQVLDHLIISDRGYYSFADEGKL